MKFGRVAIEEAEGAILAHAMRRPGLTLNKGEAVDAHAVAALRAAGVTEIVAARLEPGDVGENEAARRLAEKLAGAAVRVGASFTGRCNLFATRAGVLVVDAAGVDALNEVDEAITLATLAPWRWVAEAEMVATVKIIPYAVGAGIFLRALSVVDRPVLSVAPFALRRAGVISTLLPGLKRATIDKTLRNFEARLRLADARIVAQAEVAHETAALAAALEDMAPRCELIVVFGASAITDRRDVIPAAVEAAGGRVDHLGMPVDPGNLLLKGSLAGRPLIGAPGCARSIKENGFDFVLYRLLADLRLAPADIRRMGVGGLLTEIASRPQPRNGVAPEQATKALSGAGGDPPNEYVNPRHL